MLLIGENDSLDTNWLTIILFISNIFFVYLSFHYKNMLKRSGKIRVKVLEKDFHVVRNQSTDTVIFINTRPVGSFEAEFELSLYNEREVSEQLSQICILYVKNEQAVETSGDCEVLAERSDSQKLKIVSVVDLPSRKSVKLSVTSTLPPSEVDIGKTCDKIIFLARLSDEENVEFIISEHPHENSVC